MREVESSLMVLSISYRNSHGMSTRSMCSMGSLLCWIRAGFLIMNPFGRQRGLSIQIEIKRAFAIQSLTW